MYFSQISIYNFGKNTLLLKNSNKAELSSLDIPTPIHFLQESCRSGTYQTLSARIFNLPNIVYFRQICQIPADQTYQDNIWKLKGILQKNKCLECTENVEIVFFSFLHQEYVQIDGSTAFNILENFILSSICSRADLNMTEAVERLML